MYSALQISEDFADTMMRNYPSASKSYGTREMYVDAAFPMISRLEQRIEAIGMSLMVFGQRWEIPDTVPVEWTWGGYE